MPCSELPACQAYPGQQPSTSNAYLPPPGYGAQPGAFLQAGYAEQRAYADQRLPYAPPGR